MNKDPFTLNLEKVRLKLSHQSPQELYEKLINLGKQACHLSEQDKTPSNKVLGCQSLMYLRCDLDPNRKLLINFSSDALISAGLAAIACEIMRGLSPEEALKADLSPLETLGLGQALTPGRVNGFASVFQKIRKDALALLIKKPS